MQAVRPSNITGVPVTISVIDANNNYRTIGTVISDSAGFFSYQWTPDISGKYTVIATFAGSESYGSSHAETAFAVYEAAAEPTPEYPQPVDNTMTIVYVGVALGVLIAVVGAVIVLMLRKRP